MEVASALMPLYPSALILRIFLYLLTSINYTGPSNAHNDGTANSRAFHRAEGRMERGCFGDDISDSVNFTKILAARQLRSCRSSKFWIITYPLEKLGSCSDVDLREVLREFQADLHESLPPIESRSCPKGKQAVFFKVKEFGRLSTCNPPEQSRNACWRPSGEEERR